MTISENNKLGRFLNTDGDEGAADRALAEIYDNLNLMSDPIHEIYKSSKSRELLLDISDKGYDIEYEQSPYSFLLVVPPDCTRIDDDDHCSNTLKSIPLKIRQMLLHEYHSIGNDNKPMQLIVDPSNSNKIDVVAMRKRYIFTKYRNQSIPILSNFFIRDSISVTDLSINTLDYAQNRSGGRQIIGTNILRSQVGNQVNISYAEISSNQYGPAIITNMHRAWRDYIQSVFFGTMSPGPKYTFGRPTLKELLANNDEILIDESYDNLTIMSAVKDKFISDQPTTRTIQTKYTKYANHQRRTLNYLGGIYFFKLKPDGRTLSYWCKWTGVFPTNINVSANFSSGKNDNPVVDVTYQSQFFEENEIDILIEYNLTQLDQAFDGILSDEVGRMATAGVTSMAKGKFVNAEQLRNKSISLVLKHRTMEVYKLFVGKDEINEAVDLLVNANNEYEIVTKLTFMRNSFVTAEHMSQYNSGSAFQTQLATLFAGTSLNLDDYEYINVSDSILKSKRNVNIGDAITNFENNVHGRNIIEKKEVSKFFSDDKGMNAFSFDALMKGDFNNKDAIESQKSIFAKNVITSKISEDLYQRYQYLEDVIAANKSKTLEEARKKAAAKAEQDDFEYNAALGEAMGGP